jgi:hypothetical protein
LYTLERRNFIVCELDFDSQSFCPCLLSAGIAGMNYHTQHSIKLFRRGGGGGEKEGRKE